MIQPFGIFQSMTDTTSTPSPSSPPAASFPDGVKVLHDCPDATIDICFVHGLTGDRESTWTHPMNSAPWPKTLLPSKLSRARILTYGYDAYVVRASVASTNRLIDHANNLLHDLSSDRACSNASSRPLVFVAHSLGGLVCKEAILISRNHPEPHLRAIFNFTTGIAFMGTPHRGSWMADWARIPASSIGLVKSTNESLLHILRTEDQLLQSIQARFWEMIREQREGGRRLEVTCFYEELPLPVAGTVVSRESATLDGYTSLSIHANHRNMVRFSSADDTGFKRLLGELVRWEPQPARRPLNEEEERFVNSLRFDQIDVRYSNIKQEHAETCKWLLKNSDYLDWLNIGKLEEHHGFLWVKGNPGAGKSTLMKFALNNAKETMNNKTIISFFFNARGGDLEKSTIGMYRSLLLQLLEQLPNLFGSLGSEIRNPSLHQWGVESLESFFRKAVRSLGKSTVLCFIDALDECDENQIRDMVSFFEKIGEFTTPAGIIFQVCFASRYYPHITILKAASLNLEEQDGHSQDIAKYLRTELKIGRGQLAEEIRAEIKERASGVFLWVVLVVAILNKASDGGRTHSLRKKLRDIPLGLHELFCGILTRDRENTEELLACIQWVLFARYPLKPKQLYIAIRLRTDPYFLSSQHSRQITDSEVQKFILSSSKGLAEITRSTTNPKVQFIHQSVRDFLLKENSLKDIWSHFGTKFPGESHEQLKQDCWRYTLFSARSLDDRYFPPEEARAQEAADARKSADEAFPFLVYAVQNVLYHADEAEGGGINQIDFLNSFPVADWIKLDNLVTKFKARRHSPTASLLYILAEHNLCRLISLHNDKLSCFQVEEQRYGLPIYAALATGSYDAVRLFLKTVADIVPRESPIHDLCQQYPEIENKPTVFNNRQFNFSPRHNLLHPFKRKCDEIIVAALYASGKFDFKKADRTRSRTPLSRAVEKGFEVVVQQLLVYLADSEDDLNSTCDLSFTPLNYAINARDETMVKLLLGASKVDPNHREALFYAIELGNMAIIRQLVTHCRIDLNARNRDGHTPLSYAEARGDKAVVQLLLQTGKVTAHSGGYPPLPVNLIQWAG
ncbi:hypothetical protein GGR51DRAFT_556409 [Nemania sp. FL0031]|nr:hypothetical protein GGR51DRAFT_556409 [Nemania sp. FL0031]